MRAWRAAALPLLLAAAAAGAEPQPAAGASDVANPLEDVVVTATRREESQSKVPISVASFGAAEMQERGVKVFQDLVRLTPGLHILEDQATGANRVMIRGIASTAGTGTTGIYIDDTPIQTVRLGYATPTAFPSLFDVARVEVLLGPQGTLFGAGSEGGTVRFISTPPDLARFSGHARAEAAILRNGAPSYEVGAAFGGPLVPDRLGYRVSASLRREGGWIDLVDGQYQIVDPQGNAYGNSVRFTRTATLARDVNWNRTESLRGALTFAPSDRLAITPALLINRRYINDGAGSYYDLSTSDSSSGDFTRQGYRAGAPGAVYPFTVTGATGAVATQALVLNAVNVPANAYGEDDFTLSSLGLTWDAGPTELVASISYFDRTNTQWYDGTKDYAQYYLPEYFVAADRVTSTGTYPPPGWKAMSSNADAQANAVAELRLQSKDPNARLVWVAGVFYSHVHQSSSTVGSENFLINSPWIGFVPTAVGAGYYAVTGGPPFYAGCGAAGPCSAAQNFFGDNMLPNATSFLSLGRRTDAQLAGFGQLDYRLTDRLVLTLGLRVSSNTFDFSAYATGPESNSNAPFGGDPAGFGSPCPVAPAPCAFGSGALAPSYPASATHGAETATTPKYGLTYRIADDHMVYGTAAKGFRPPGASLRVPSICDSDLVQNGYVDANGNPVQPTTYRSDSVWSYELGSKNRLLGGRLVLDGSVYDVKWRGIQTTILLNGCGASFVDNLADATSRGFDLAFRLSATDRLGLDGSVGYNKATFDEDAKSPSGTRTIYNGGSSIPNAGPPWKVSLSTEYAAPLASGRLGYARFDYTFTSEWRRYGVTDPGTASYDPRRTPIPAYGIVNARLGVRLDALDVSLFVDNITNAAPDLLRYSDPNYDPQDWHSVTIRPRTYGLTVAWHR